jgi:type I restriction enzyme S subunit
MVPKGWDLTAANDICHSISVGIVIKPSQYYVPESEGVKAFRSANVREGFINDTDWVYLSQEGHDANKKSQLLEGDVLIVRTGYPGTACVVTKDFEGMNAIDIVIARPNKNKILPEYLCAYTNSEIGKAQVLNLQGGMAQKHLNVGAYQELKIKLPPISEQKKIAKILSTWDHAISTTEKLLAHSQQQKKALMQQLLTGKQRLPSFQSASWTVCKFKDIFDRITTRNVNGDKNVLTISGRYGLISQKDAFNRVIASDDLSNYILLKRGDFAFNKSYSLGYPYGAIKPLEKYAQGIVSALYICFRLKDTNKHDHDFFRHFFEGGYFDHEIYAIAQEGARNHGLLNVSVTDFFNGHLRCPSLKEQIEIANVINRAEHEVLNLEGQLKLLTAQKRALMQQLLTGKRRVKVDES